MSISPDVMSGTAFSLYAVQGGAYNAAVMSSPDHAIVRVEPPFTPTRGSLAPFDSEGTRLSYAAAEDATYVDIQPAPDSELVPGMVRAAVGELVLGLDKSQPATAPWWAAAQKNTVAASDVA